MDIRMDIDEKLSVGDYKSIQQNSEEKDFSFLDSDDSKNIFISEEKGIFRVLEYKIDLSSKNPNEAMSNYFMNRARVFKKQLLVTLGTKYIETYENAMTTKINPDNPQINTVFLNPQNMMYMDGNIEVGTNVESMGDLIGKTLSSKATGESIIKPKYTGNGYVMLEPTYKYVVLHSLEKRKDGQDRGIIISDGSFLASSGSIRLRQMPLTTISAAALGRERFFSLNLRGEGVVAYTSPVPKSDITVIELKNKNDIVRINGNYALAWSDTLFFSVEPASLSLLGSAVSSEGYVNVYKGKGKIWLANY